MVTIIKRAQWERPPERLWKLRVVLSDVARPLTLNDRGLRAPLLTNRASAAAAIASSRRALLINTPLPAYPPPVTTRRPTAFSAQVPRTYCRPTASSLIIFEKPKSTSSSLAAVINNGRDYCADINCVANVVCGRKNDFRSRRPHRGRRSGCFRFDLKAGACGGMGGQVDSIEKKTYVYYKKIKSYIFLYFKDGLRDVVKNRFWYFRDLKKKCF